jgi:two-component system, LytTR family, sensor kinase
MINPYIRSKKIFSFYGMIWCAIAVAYFSIIVFALHTGWRYAAVEAIVFNGIYMALGISFWYIASFNSIENYSPAKIVINHVTAAVITSGIWVGASFFIVASFWIDNKDYKDLLYNTLIWRFLIGILFYSVLTAVNYVIIYYNSFQNKLLREAELNTFVKEAELKSLKYQINPHFIFNSLNSISSLTINDPDKAREMTIKLSQFLRSTLSKNERQKNKLSEEIANAKLYLEIEKVRFEDRLEFEEEIGKYCSDIEVPNMILQPLFENAVKHGVYESIEKVTIKLTCKLEKDYLQITVTNNFDPEAVSSKGEGIGLKNIRSRLKLIYNQENLLAFKKENGLFTVNIYIPLAIKENENE